MTPEALELIKALAPAVITGLVSLLIAYLKNAEGSVRYKKKA